MLAWSCGNTSANPLTVAILVVRTICGAIGSRFAPRLGLPRDQRVTALSEIPAKHGVKNVYADLGQLFAQSTVANPKVCAAMMAQLVQGLGADHVVWGTDAIWTGSPQWQIEALRRREVPEDMQKKYGFKPLGPADGPIKTAILGENNARLYKYDKRSALATDRLAVAKAAYEESGGLRSNRRYGYVVGPRA